ncbi:hypothetical protein Pint_12179 [Pistacia integerrima]|uniref:Uncharacterized protein n=1 Tax=Pistacia integerrima TaxID=434235 RepID=A0ACC0XHE3_9ROSI|nr:hypothetical protein Pint_12179 [Pistacia integerrima]
MERSCTSWYRRARSMKPRMSWSAKASEIDKNKIEKNRGEKGGFMSLHSMGSGRVESSFSDMSISSGGSGFDRLSLYDSRNSVLEWSMLLIDNSNRSGLMEFVVPPTDLLAFFPISVRFSASNTFSDLKVVNILPLRGGPSPRFSQKTVLSTENYQVMRWLVYKFDALDYDFPLAFLEHTLNCMRV